MEGNLLYIISTIIEGRPNLDNLIATLQTVFQPITSTNHIRVVTCHQFLAARSSSVISRDNRWRFCQKKKLSDRLNHLKIADNIKL